MSTAPGTPSSQVTVPEVIGRDKVAAKEELKKAKLQVKTKEMRSLEAAGTVVDANPEEQSVVDENAEVTLSVSDGRRVTKSGKWAMWLGALALVGAIFLVALFSPGPSITPANAAAVLALVTAGAVAIERIIEAGWTVVGLRLSTSWPMSQPKQAMNSGLEQQARNAYEKAKQIVTSVADAQDKGDDWAEKIYKEIGDLQKTTLQDLKTLAQSAPDNQGARLVANTVDQSLAFIEKKYPELKEAMGVAGQAIDITADFVETFKDNPGRRLISIFAGSILGLAAAGFLGLDAFQAAMATPAEESAAGGGAGASQFPLGIVFTGLLMGLGSVPTHEVIKLVQEAKKGRKAANLELPG
jgi:PASTA domain